MKIRITIIASLVATIATLSAATTLAGTLPVTDTSLVLWLDADDLDGDGLIEGLGESGLSSGDVTTWVDKSASGGDNIANNATPGTAPSYHLGVSQSGSAVVRFDRDNSEYLDISTLPSVDSEWTVFVVASLSVAVENEETVLFLGEAQKERRLHVAIASGSSDKLFSRVLDYPEDGSVEFNAFQSDTFQVYSSTGDDTGSDFEITAYTDGNPEGTSTKTLDLANITYDKARIGMFPVTPTPGRYLEGDISEIILYNRVLNPTERQQVEAYLSGKWIPEPGSLTLLLAALGLLALRRTRQTA